MRYARQIARMIQVDTVRRPGADKENFDRLHAVMAELFPVCSRGCRRWEFETACSSAGPGGDPEGPGAHEPPGCGGGARRMEISPSPAPSPMGSYGARGPGREGNLHASSRRWRELMEAGYTPSGTCTSPPAMRRRPAAIPSSWTSCGEQGSSRDVGGRGLVHPALPGAGLRRPRAMVSVAEKGYIDVKCGPGARRPRQHPRQGDACPAWAPSCAVENTDLFPRPPQQRQRRDVPPHGGPLRRRGGGPT